MSSLKVDLIDKILRAISLGHRSFEELFSPNDEAFAEVVVMVFASMLIKSLFFVLLTLHDRVVMADNALALDITGLQNLFTSL